MVTTLAIDDPEIRPVAAEPRRRPSPVRRAGGRAGEGHLDEVVAAPALSRQRAKEHEEETEGGRDARGMPKTPSVESHAC